jgi:hypothetical protein
VIVPLRNPHSGDDSGRACHATVTRSRRAINNAIQFDILRSVRSIFRIDTTYLTVMLRLRYGDCDAAPLSLRNVDSAYHRRGASRQMQLQRPRNENEEVA